MATVLLLSGAKSLQNATAEGDTRSLALHHMHTGEDLAITYKRDGRYDEAALQKLNVLLRDWRRDEQTRMDPHLLDILWEVYREVGAKEPIQVVCGYRSPQTNAMLRHRSAHTGVAQFSQHMLGRAMDFYIPGVPLEAVRTAGLRLQRGGVGFYPTSGSPFVHLDTGNVRHWPRMTHDQLVRVFPDGKTVHVPSDGRPLSRYAQAMTDLNRHGGSVSANSFAEARSAGAITNTEKPKRGFLAKLFGFTEPDEEAEDKADTRAPTLPARAAPSSTPQNKPQLASIIPLPIARPANQQALATAQTAPIDVINSRGNWNSATAPSARYALADHPAGPLGSSGHRFVWSVGPKGHAIGRAQEPTQHTEDSLAPGPETTQIGPWSVATRSDRVPTEVALAYAAAASEAEVMHRPVATAIRAEPRAPAPTLTSRLVPALSGARVDNPWLRGVVVSPSIQHTMSVTILGPTDYRTLAPLMRKPPAAVAMVFSDDPLYGMAIDTFSGAAISFVPTITFLRSHTAGLN
jgi:uncharacterized protein YcbK (DUF882 family)